ncbi:hydantoinase/oxoprolinase family protein [Aeromicrobium sp. YIM 150415]|uniref:hydantoinase/oxoprolinase family protein n=1 Tax=Aeromicrobium sp. YIM 150415 TaxID=2803912 RepID=UPI001964B2D3|nr:hydantoinase/oxoprolinase family protein [Aeromicrobium sp. YIM 150415]MBM9461979.1 hydantoinase/oxoprolinase family protein [Aeromicrobium sp. YIM 150415]
MSTGNVRIGVDVGGTFTDLLLHDPSRALTWTGKLPTTPEAPHVAITDGIARILRETETRPGDVAGVVHGTTLVTNTVLERTGAQVGFLTTRGFRDIPEMGQEIRFDTTDLFARPAPPLVQRDMRLEIGGRLSAQGQELEPLDDEEVLTRVAVLRERGAEALAVCLLHAHVDPLHELRVRDLVAKKFPDLPVTLSAEVAPVMREYERGNTACMNAYVQPLMAGYLDRLRVELDAMSIAAPLRIMLSGGGITTLDEAKAHPVRLLESGPAAGAIAASAVARSVAADRVISFDMGGTTAKMAIVHHGRPRVTHDFEAGRVDKFKPGSGLPVKLTVVDMIEIGSGGGSIASRDRLGLLKVGPRSAGSVPGPIAYGRGGTSPTVTDADAWLGFLDADNFLGGEMHLDLPAVEARLEAGLAQELELSPLETAVGIERVVTESMAAATRMHLAEKGLDPSDHTLLAFGGAGPVHAYALAKALKLSRLIVPLRAGVMSAYGFLVAPPLVNEVRSHQSEVTELDWEHVRALFDDMERRARHVLGDDEIDLEFTADMRYVGQGFEIEVPLPAGCLDGGGTLPLLAAFAEAYRAVFGRVVDEGRIEVVAWRLTATSPSADFGLGMESTGGKPSRGTRTVHLPETGTVEASVYDRYAMRPGDVVVGPAVFEERESSCVIGPDATAVVDEGLNLLVSIG